MDNKKTKYDAKECAECEQLWDDDGTLRCKYYDNAIIEDTKEKNCKDSIY